MLTLHRHRRHPAPKPSGRDSVASLKVVVAYGDVRAGRRALKVLARLLDEDGEWHLFPEVWRFDLLEDADWREQATIDAVNADLLILSTSKSGAIPVAIESWVSALLARRRGTPLAMLALCGAKKKQSILVQDTNGARIDPCSSNTLITSDAFPIHARQAAVV